VSRWRRDRIRSLLEIVGSAEDAQGAIDLAAWRLPDVALLVRSECPAAAARGGRDRPAEPFHAGARAVRGEDRESVLTMIRAGR
jgi:hypothetical protein